jgi:hypothetical protein
MANIILLPFDQQMLALPGHYLRYADDMMVVCENEQAATWILAKAAEALAPLGLSLNRGKTQILPLEEAAFLGCGFGLMGQRWVRKLPEATMQACCEHLASLVEVGKTKAELQQFLASWMAYFLPGQEDRLHHAEFLNAIQKRFLAGENFSALQDFSPSGQNHQHPPAGFAYNGAYAHSYHGWNKAAWAGRFLLRRVRFGLTFRRKGFMPVPSGLCINIMGHRIHIRL